MAGLRVTVVTLAVGLMVGTPVVAGAGETAGAPDAGSTFQGTAPRVSVDLTVLAPDSDGGAQVRALVAIECPDDGDGTPAGLEDVVGGRVAPDGTFAISARVSGPAEGLQSFGNVRLRGTFTDTGLDATIRYELTETDDADEVIDECEAGPVPVDFETGPVDPGLALVQAAIPLVKPANPHYLAATATTGTDVVVAIRTSEFSDDRTTLLLRIDPETNEIVRRRTVDDDLWGLVAVDDRLFGIDVVDGDVVPIDPSSLETDDAIDVAEDGDPGELRADSAALWPRGAALDGALWVSASRDREILRIDPERGEVDGRVDVERSPTNLAAGPAGLYAETEGDGGNIVRVDPTTMQVAASSTPRPSIDGVVADDSQVLTTDYDPDSEVSTVVALDPSTLEPTSSREYDPAPELVIAAPPGSWGLQYERPVDVIVALGPDLAEVARVVAIEPGDGETQAAAGFGAVWIYDEGLRLLYRISST